MLREISIRDIVLINKLDLEIGGGFTALTGETGAGKSILLDSLGLTLGDRADKGLVRSGQEKAIASSRFEISEDHLAYEVLKQNDIDIENNEIVLRRSITKDGKSRAFINDISVSASTLKALSASLLEVHGQHSAIGLMDESHHINMLDSYLSSQLGDEFTKILNKTYDAYKELVAADKNLKEAKERMGKSGAERDYLAHVLTELQTLAPRIGEEKELDIQRRFLMGSEKIAETVKESLAAIESGKVENNLAQASRSLSRIGNIEGEGAKKLNTLIENAAQALENAQNEVAEALGHLQNLGFAIDLDPKELELIEERLFALRAAARKHNVLVDELPKILAKIALQLQQIDNCDEELAKAEERFEKAQKDYYKKAVELSKLRQKGAKIFEEKIMAELPPLKLEKMRFACSFEETKAAGEKGTDKIIFEIAPNPGAGFGPLSQIASGGELSRLSLALKVVLSSSQGNLALVFDEVDQGIGGATADAVGRRLAKLAQNSQVLCVTHSPQVAARADHHFKIQKSVINGQTITNVTKLNDIEREEEIARMLAGENITEEARAAAKALFASK